MCAGSSADVECFMVYRVPLVQQCRSSWLPLAVCTGDTAIPNRTVHRSTLQHEQSSCSKLAVSIQQQVCKWALTCALAVLGHADVVSA
jgi:hypothetical protein